MSDLMLDVSQAHELKMAFRREGPWTNEDIKKLCERRGILFQLYQVLQGRARIVLEKMAVWIFTTVGGFSKEEVIAKLQDDAGDRKRFDITEMAMLTLNKADCVIESIPEKVSFVLATPVDLGFVAPPTFKEIMNNDFLEKFGLELCKSGDGPFIRLAYRDQPDKSGNILVAMEPIRDVRLEGEDAIFSLIRGSRQIYAGWPGSTLWLEAETFDDRMPAWAELRKVERKCNIHQPFVFRIRKASQPSS